MKINGKSPNLINRFMDTWKDEGFIIATKRAMVKIRHRIQLEIMERNLYRVRERYYREIYQGYLATSLGKKEAEYVDLPAYDLSQVSKPVKVLAFYLPQYHPIPENDAWWGKGFTEWTNVSKATPNFIGHYQPHLPGELGFYDLRLPEVIQRQVALARQFGLHGFCFYYYWFDGKRLLDLPLELYLKIPGNNFPFCLCWANENWTRTWDGLDQKVLIAQKHSPEGDFAFIKDIDPYLRDPRYIRINGRLVLMVYRPQILPDPASTVSRWRAYCHESGLGDPYLIAIQSGEISDPRSLGFDAAAEFPPHGIPTVPYINQQVKITNSDFKGMVFDYEQIAEQLGSKTPTDYRLFKTVITGWDNTPRRQNQAFIFHNATPKIYQEWLASAIQFTLKHNPDAEQLVWINAWNEWAEGTHLEPDRKYGYAFLDATARVLNPAVTATIKAETFPLIELPRKHDTAVVLHIYYPELWDEIRDHLDHLAGDFDLYVSIPEGVYFDKNLILEKYPEAFIYRCHNRGRDMAPFIQFLSLITKAGYMQVCKLHTKKSLHREDGTLWRTEIYNELLGSLASVDEIKQQLLNPDIGLIGPKNHILSTQYFMGGNEKLVSTLANRLNLGYSGEPFTFIAGSMYWFKPQAIATVLELNLDENDFPEETGQIDGTLAHAMERLIGLAAHQGGYKVIQTGTFSEIPNNDYQFAVPYLKA